MTAAEIASDLGSFAGRRGGSDAERRAALWLAERLRSQGRATTIETFWCRPNWALAHAWHAVLGLAASVLIVSHAPIGGALALVTVVSIAVDAATGRSLGRRLTPERASQNVVAPDPAETPDAARLIVTANYDAGRAGLVYRPGPRTLAARLRRAAAGGRLTPGWLGWLTIALLWLIVVAIVRRGGTSGTAIDVLQLVPSIGLVAAAVAPGVAADVAARGLIAWTQLFGMISFELFGQLVGTADPADDFFGWAVDQTATLVGLPPA